MAHARSRGRGVSLGNLSPTRTTLLTVPVGTPPWLQLRLLPAHGPELGGAPRVAASAEGGDGGRARDTTEVAEPR